MRGGFHVVLGGFSRGRDVGRARYAHLPSERRCWGCPESSGRCCCEGIKAASVPGVA